MERGKPIIRRKWQGGTPIRAVGIEASQGITFSEGPPRGLLSLHPGSVCHSPLPAVPAVLFNTQHRAAASINSAKPASFCYLYF